MAVVVSHGRYQARTRRAEHSIIMGLSLATPVSPGSACCPVGGMAPSPGVHLWDNTVPSSQCPVLKARCATCIDNIYQGRILNSLYMYRHHRQGRILNSLSLSAGLLVASTIGDAGFDGGELRQTALVPLERGELGAEKDGDKHLCQLDADDPRPETEDVGIVVEHALPRRKSVMSEGRADTGEAIGGDRRPDAAPTKQKTALGITIEHRVGHRARKIRVIARRGIMGAEIGYLMSHARQPGAKLLLHFEPRVIGGNDKLHLLRVLLVEKRRACLATPLRGFIGSFRRIVRSPFHEYPGRISRADDEIDPFRDARRKDE